jgi:hypothetical protein
MHPGARPGLLCSCSDGLHRTANIPDPRGISPDNAGLSYGSDNAGGVYLHLGDARIHLSGDAAHDLAAGLMAEATRPASPAPEEPADG